MAAERQNETHKRAPNCRHIRFVCKTKGVCTRTPHGNICFHTVKNYDALFNAFQPRMLVDDQIHDAPDGIYCWIIRKRGRDYYRYAMKVICEQEIGSLHNFIFLLSSKSGPLLTEAERFIDAHEVIAAGELKVEGAKREFNLQSGSFMEPIFRMTGWQPINRRRIPKTREMLAEEIAQRETERKKLTDQVAPYLSAAFASMPSPELDGALNRTTIVEHVKSVSEALGGRPLIKGVEIMVSENNMGFLHSLMSTDPPASEEHSHARPNAGPAKKAKASHPPKQPKRGGTRRIRKRLYKKQTRRC